jgi:hypothetical protein
VFLTSVKQTDDQSVNFLDIGIAQLHACVPTDLITRIALRWSVAHHGRELLGSASPDDVSLYRREFGSNLRKGLSLADRYHIMKEKFRMDPEHNKLSCRSLNWSSCDELRPAALKLALRLLPSRGAPRSCPTCTWMQLNSTQQISIEAFAALHRDHGYIQGD